MRSRHSHRRDAEWIRFGRSFLFTFGLGLLCVGTYALRQPSNGTAPWWQWVILLGLLFVGVLLIWMSIFAPDGRVAHWAERSSVHELAIIIMIVAIPLYLFLRIVKRR